jgi:hypothetical protein
MATFQSPCASVVPVTQCWSALPQRPAKRGRLVKGEVGGDLNWIQDEVGMKY